MTSWFRSWHGAPTDNKWLVIARRANVAPGVVSAVAWALLDYASQAADRGSVAGFDVETYCAFAGFPETDVAAVLIALHDKNVIDADERLTAWDKRQPKREDDSADRVRAWREHRGKIAPSNTVTQRNALSNTVTQRNALSNTVTQRNAPDQIRSDQIRSEAETETDHAPAAQDNDDPDPVTRAIRNAYDACGLMMTKTHLDAHRETIARCGLPAWQKGFTVALDASKHNIPSYVARCAESAMLAAQRGNGNGKPKVDQSFEALQKRYG